VWQRSAAVQAHCAAAISTDPVRDPHDKKSGREILHRRSLIFGDVYSGLVVVVVVVSSRLITAAGRANTTLRTTTRSPTVE
jgi:hypothetical protein